MVLEYHREPRLVALRLQWSNVKAYSNETAILKSRVICITDPPCGLNEKMCNYTITPNLTDKWTIMSVLVIGILISIGSRSSVGLRSIFHFLITP